MAYNKVGVTPVEMMEMRRSGMSNLDIAKSLDISTETVRNYIGKQGGRMEGFEAFKDTPPRKKTQEEAPCVPPYEPEALSEVFAVGKNYVADIDYMDRVLVLKHPTCEIKIAFDEIPDVLQFLAWAARERIKE